MKLIKSEVMLEYYKLALVRAGEDSQKFRQELRKALRDLDDPSQVAELREWFKNRYRLSEPI